MCETIYLLISEAWPPLTSSSEGTPWLMLERNTPKHTHTRTPTEKTRASQLLSSCDTPDPWGPRCYYHHPRETETDCETKAKREQPADPSESLHLFPQLQHLQCGAVQNAARGQAAAAFAIRHVVSPCESREESHPATISSSSLCLAAFFSFPHQRNVS